MRRISAMIPTAIIIALSTGPYLTNQARLFHTMLYCRPKGRVRRQWVMKVDEDCSHQMVVTAPLTIFTDSPVKEHRSTATGESAFRCCEELNKKEIQRVKGIAYHYYQYGVVWVT